MAAEVWNIVYNVAERLIVTLKAEPRSYTTKTLQMIRTVVMTVIQAIQGKTLRDWIRKRKHRSINMEHSLLENNNIWEEICGAYDWLVKNQKIVHQGAKEHKNDYQNVGKIFDLNFGRKIEPILVIQ